MSYIRRSISKLVHSRRVRVRIHSIHCRPKSVAGRQSPQGVQHRRTGPSIIQLLFSFLSPHRPSRGPARPIMDARRPAARITDSAAQHSDAEPDKTRRPANVSLGHSSGHISRTTSTGVALFTISPPHSLRLPNRFEPIIFDEKSPHIRHRLCTQRAPIFDSKHRSVF